MKAVMDKLFSEFLPRTAAGSSVRICSVADAALCLVVSLCVVILRITMQIL